MNKNIILLLIIITVVASGLFVPGIILNIEANDKIDKVTTLTHEDNHYNPAILKNASVLLTDFERIQLISKDWDSNILEAPEGEGELSKIEALKLVKNSIKQLYNKKHYPVDLTSQYDNWYKWNATLYKAIDSHFHTYAAYFWRFNFTRYDGSEAHTIDMAENGTILAASTNASCDDIKEFKKIDFPSASSFIPIDISALSTPKYYDSYKVYKDALISCCLVMENNSNIKTLDDVRAIQKEKSNFPCYLYYESYNDKDGIFTYCQIPYLTNTAND